MTLSARHCQPREDVEDGLIKNPGFRHCGQLSTDHSLKEIAFDLGFADASYFNRFFKRETGVTPAGYRADIRKMYH